MKQLSTQGDGAPTGAEEGETMTDERLAELERLADAATPGPWEPLTPASGKWVCSLAPGAIGMAWRRNHTNDAAFVAAARTAIPELIAEVRRHKALEDAALD